MTKLEEKFYDAIDNNISIHNKITEWQGKVNEAANTCTSICKEEMKMFDEWKGQDGWIPTLNYRGALFYKCSKGQASFEQLIELYLNQEGEK